MKRDRKPTPEVSPEIAALDRLSKDGASSNAAVRRRIALIAAERNLAPSETKALMRSRRLSLFLLGQFAKKHHLSVDWLIGGNLKAFRETVQIRADTVLQVATTPEMASAQWREYLRHGQLSNASVPVAIAYLRNLSSAEQS